MEENVYIPADVPNRTINEYLNNYDQITLGSGRLMLFAGDQKIEHLNDDFYGEGIHEDDNTPEHLFKIANAAEIGVKEVKMRLKFILIFSVDLERLFKKFKRLTEITVRLSKRATRYLRYLATLFDRYFFLLHPCWG